MQSYFLTDTELIQRYIGGSELALEEIISRHKDKVFNYIRKLVKDRDLADDIFQDTFIKAIKTIKLGAYNEEGKFLPWVMRIAHNLVIDHFRKEKRMPSFSGTDEFNIFDTIKAEEKNKDEEFFWEQVQVDIKNLVELLPDEQKEVLKMRIYCEMSFKEIAEETNVSINTALGRMRYALINMRKLINEKNVILSD